MNNTYHVRAWKAYNAEVKWWFVNVEVSDCVSNKTFEFIYHDEPDKKLIQVCSLRALRAFGLEKLDELSNPFDKNNEKAFGYNDVKVTQVSEETTEKNIIQEAHYLGWEHNSLKADKEPSIRNNFLDPDKKANDFDDEDDE